MKNIFIERQKNLLRIAIVVENKLTECFIQEEDTLVYPGQIYKGVVKNIVPAIKCAFIDLGTGKNGYMYMDSKFNNIKLKKGDEFLVEVIKESMGTKGPKVSNKITVPGRYAVIETLNNEISISKKIVNENIKEQFKTSIKKPKDVGVMIRTNAEKVTIDEINNEIERLYGVYRDIVKKGNYSNEPELIYNAGGVLGKVLRDIVDENTEKIIMNDKDDFIFIKNYITNKADMNAKVEHHEHSIPIMDYYGIEKKILEIRKHKIELPCGGSIVIDKTEAMYVIDVNSGKNVKERNIRNTAEFTNIQAAKEISRQIILRNLSGIIVIDFIDLDDIKAKNKILDTLNYGFKEDKNKTIIYPFTELNIVQIARRRRGKSILDYIEQNCKVCYGSGKILKLSYLTNLLRNKVIRIDSENISKHIYIEISHEYKLTILKYIDKFVKSIESEEKSVYVKFIKDMDTYKVEPLIFKSQIEDCNIYKIYG
ncbi:ribonuclease E/G [Clostridium sp.]|uniref:Rne/Rng family ribonuclease n=1 Tax=Clostridium sp. TaxID=1506 RepID=UPI00258A041E|nr:ribonuclease E/G [Clostridium sp.]MDF2504390.1 ribonuclease [Clostridium sp.]